MSDTAPGVVVFGTGFGCYTHVGALRSAGFEVKAVVGRDPEKTARRARLYDVPRALTSVEEALDLPGVDAVTIATPPNTHAAITLAALGRGKHVICEKPFARDLDRGRGASSMRRASEPAWWHSSARSFDSTRARQRSRVSLAIGVRSESRDSPPSSSTSVSWPIAPEPSSSPSWWRRGRYRVADGSVLTGHR